MTINLVTEHFPPYQFEDSSGEVQGFSTDVVRAMFEQTPYDYTIQVYPWTRAYHKAIQDKNTCIYLISKEPHRVDKFQWVAPIVSTTDYFIGLSDNHSISINSIEDAKNYKVAVLKDDRTHSNLLSFGFIEQENLYVINSTYSLLKLLMSRDEIDLILADTINVVYRAKYNNIDPQIFKAFYKVSQKPVELYLACSNDTPESVVITLRKALDKIKAIGQFDYINKKWNLIATPVNSEEKANNARP